MIVQPTIKQLLAEGRTVYVWYYNGHNDQDCFPFTGTILKLVPTGDGRYNRFWRNEANTDWQIPTHPAEIDCNTNQDIEQLNDGVHHYVFKDEEEAVEAFADFLKNPEEFPFVCNPFMEQDTV